VLDRRSDRGECNDSGEERNQNEITKGRHLWYYEFLLATETKATEHRMMRRTTNQGSSVLFLLGVLGKNNYHDALTMSLGCVKKVMKMTIEEGVRLVRCMVWYGMVRYNTIHTNLTVHRRFKKEKDFVNRRITVPYIPIVQQG
jgi:hypothetical protein